MARIASRELRNETASVLRRVEAGGRGHHRQGRGSRAARPGPPSRRRWLTRSELAARLATVQADATLSEDLRRIAGDDTDDLGEIR